VGVGCGVEQLAQSLARPGGNFTGVSCQSLDLPAKHLQLLSEMMPSGRQIVALVNPDSRSATTVTEQLKEAAAQLNLVVSLNPVRKPDMVETAIGEIARLGALGAIVAPDPLFWAERETLVAAAKKHRIGIIASYREFTDLGGLVSYGRQDPERRQARRFTDGATDEVRAGRERQSRTRAKAYDPAINPASRR
jgi:putative tryptophan/tyrosine transport system substrate-binding protein